MFTAERRPPDGETVERPRPAARRRRFASELFGVGAFAPCLFPFAAVAFDLRPGGACSAGLPNLPLMLRTQDGKRLARLLFYSRIQKMSTLCPQNCRADSGRFARRGEEKALRNGAHKEYRKRARHRKGSAAGRTAPAAPGTGRVGSPRGAGIAEIRRRRSSPPARFADARPIYGFCVKSEALCGAVPDGGGQPVRVSSASVMSMPSESPDQLTLSRTMPRCSMTPPECSFSSPPRLR